MLLLSPGYFSLIQFKMSPARAAFQCGAPHIWRNMVCSELQLYLFNPFQSSEHLYSILHRFQDLPRFLCFQVALRSLHHLALGKLYALSGTQVRWTDVGGVAGHPESEKKGNAQCWRKMLYFTFIGSPHQILGKLFGSVAIQIICANLLHFSKHMGSILTQKGSHPNICWKNCQTVFLEPVHASHILSPCWLHPQPLKETLLSLQIKICFFLPNPHIYFLYMNCFYSKTT